MKRVNEELIFDEYKVHEYLGAHHVENDIYIFRVWAPKAKSVSVVGDFNDWNSKDSQLELDPEKGIWSAQIAGVKPGDCYKFSVLGNDDINRFKADPFARQTELRPHDASVIYAPSEFEWEDQDFWNVEDIDTTKIPINIYEVHLGSWQRKEDGSFYNYKEIAPKLGQYVKDLNYTHIQILPLMEHAQDESIGYSVTGFYAPTARYGSPEDFKYFVNYMHGLGIKVIMDCVPTGFSLEDYGLSKFDGSSCYGITNHNESNEAVTVFDFSKKEVRAFLLSNAYYWISEYHLDGLKFDNLEKIISENDLKSNYYNNHQIDYHSMQAINFVLELNTMIHEEFNGVLSIAHNSSNLNNVTNVGKDKGLDFDLKWDYGWLKDTLEYFMTPYDKKSEVHSLITFSMMYNFHERFILPLSHQEVIQGYGSLISKMPGDYWRQFASLRTLNMYRLCHPGAKLLFMGGELGQFVEWDVNSSLQWFLLDYAMHKQFLAFIKAANALYLDNPEMWEDDKTWSGFTWLNNDDDKRSTYSWVRRDLSGNVVICLFNMTPNPVDSFKVAVPKRGAYQVIFNSDDAAWGGSNYNMLKNITETNLHPDNFSFGEALYDWNAKPYFETDETVNESGVNGIVYSRDIANKNYKQSIKLNLPPLSAVVLRHVADDPKAQPLSPWPDPELAYPKDFNPFNKAADEGFELN